MKNPEKSGTGSAGHPPLYTFWQPRYWPLWILVGFLRAVVLLPDAPRRQVGKAMGRLLSLVLRGRRRVAAINLQLCFPELTDGERSRLLHAHFAALGEAAMELGLALWATDEQVRHLVQVEGVEHLRPFIERGQGVILLSAHMGSLELCGRALALQIPRLAILYRPNRNLLLDALQLRTRARATPLVIPKDDMRQLVRTLRSGFAVWYAPDQSHRRKYSALVPFFGEPAMTNTAITELVRLGRAGVVPTFARRLPGKQGLVVELLPPLADFPGTSPEADATRVNAVLADYIRKAPEQYYWLHRRFKDRPVPLPDPYA